MHFIFDFDGTLVNSYDCVISKFNLLAKEFKFREVDDAEILTLKNFSSKELISYLQIPLYKLPIIIHKARLYVQADILKLPIYTGLKEILQELKAAGHQLGIVTSNANITVKQWLRIHGLHNTFHFIHTESSYFGKQHVLKKIIQQQKLSRLKTYYIGDETRDIIAAKQVHVRSVAVTWGYNSEMILKRESPDFVIHIPTDLLHI